jgi:hypothetical protein
MKRVKRFFVGVLFAVFSVAYAHSAALGAGIPAVIYLPGQAIVLINFNQNQYASTEVNQLIAQVQSLVQSALGGTSISLNTGVLTPDTLTQIGYGDADAVNTLLTQPGVLTSLGMSAYIRIDATKPQGPQGQDYRLDAFIYTPNASVGNFTYVVGIEIPTNIQNIIGSLISFN